MAKRRRPMRYWGMALGLVLTAPGYAQDAPKPTVPTMAGPPEAPTAAADTTQLRLQHAPGGIRFVFHTRGTGPLALAGRRVAVRYAGFLPDGHLFDASPATGGALRFRVGHHEVIAGWDALLPLLPAGSRVRAWIPAAQAYGTTGVPDPDDETQWLIPPDTALLFELFVESVK